MQALQRLKAMGLDLDEAQAVLDELYGESYVAGAWVAAEQAIDAGADAGGLASWLSTVDWSNWQPGNNAAAVLLAQDADGTGGLAELLDNVGITIKGVGDTLLDQLGDSLGEGMAGGESISDLADRVDELLGDEGRGDIIARTESARAASVASSDQFADLGVTGKEWMTFDPCDICEENEGDGVIALDDTFSSGDDEPPAHPNCECALAPVVDVGSDEQ